MFSGQSSIRAVTVVVWALAAAAAPVGQSPESTAIAAGSDVATREIPDLSGVWFLERADGNLPQRAVSALGARPPVRLTIVQTPTDLTIRREVEGRGYVGVFPLSGVEAMQDTPHGPMKTRANWDGAVLIIEGTRPLPFFLGKRQVPFQQRHSVIDDGRIMVVDLVLETPRGPRTWKAVFHRAEK